MKKTYTTAQIELVMFSDVEVIVASAVAPETPASTTYNKEDDETEML